MLVNAARAPNTLTSAITRPLILLMLLTLAACGGRPQKVLDEAEVALAEAILAKKCAPEEYAAAERMYAEANRLADEGKHDEAERAGRAARKLAEKARDKAASVKEECLRPKPKEPEGFDPNQFVDPAQPGAFDGQGAGEMGTVYFDFNAAELTPQARETVNKNAEWIRRHPGSRVALAGHCDKRGSTEYNLALGERRALIVYKYLRTLGVDADRLVVVSYGKEQLAEYGDSETAHAQNRRVEFLPR